MYRVKPILGFVGVAAFLVAVVAGGVNAGELLGKKLLVDTVFNMVEDNADKVNEGINTIAPSMSMAGGTIKVELFIEEGGGNDIIGGTVEFADSNMDMMFDDSWQIVGVDGIVAVLGTEGIQDDSFILGGLTPVTIGDNDYFATVKIMAKADIADGASFYVKHAVIGTGRLEQDSLDVSEAIVAVEAPKDPTISLSLDGDSSAGDQGVTNLDVSAEETVPIQVFARDIIGANGISTRFEYSAAQVAYQGFDAGSLLPSAQILTQHHTNPTAVEISVVSFGGQATADSGLVGTARFNTTDMLSETTIRLVRAVVGRGDTRESIMPSGIGVTLRMTQITSDFNGDGRVDFVDFLAFGMRFGASRGDATYEAKYDLDQDGTIGFGDFLIFGQEFGASGQ